jgi:hypothetical protein
MNEEISHSVLYNGTDRAEDLLLNESLNSIQTRYALLILVILTEQKKRDEGG